MTKRTLRPEIRTALEIITAALILCFASLEDFELNALPALIGAFALLMVNLKVLEKF